MWRGHHIEPRFLSGFEVHLESLDVIHHAASQNGGRFEQAIKNNIGDDDR